MAQMILDDMLAEALGEKGVGYSNLSDVMPDDPDRAWWAKKQNSRNIDTYVLHHSAGASNGSPEGIYRYHFSNWGGVGYHFMVHCYEHDMAVIQAVYRTRSPFTWGAHVGGQNENKLGICWLGTYHEAPPHPSALKAGLSIFTTLRWVFQRWSGATGQFVAHRHLAPTQCPGGEWVEEFLNNVNAPGSYQAGYTAALLEVEAFIQELLDG